MGQYIFIIVLVSLFAFFENKNVDFASLGKNQKQTQPAFILLALILTFYAAVRYATGSDCLSYYNYFDFITHGDSERILSMYEPGFAYLYLILGSFFETGQCVIVVTSIIINVLIADTIRRLSPRPYFSLFCYVCFYYYFLSFNILRQFVGISIVLWGLQFLLKRSKVGDLIFVACCFVAASFHYSAIFSLLMLLLVRVKQNTAVKAAFTILIIAGFVFDTYFIQLFSSYTKYTNYDVIYGKLNSSNSSVVILLFFLLVSWLLENFFTDKIKNYNFYQNCLAFGIFLNVLSETNIMFGRVAYYYTTILIIFVPMIVSNIKNSMAIKFVIIAVAIAYCIWNLSNNNGGVVPYQFCF